MTHKHNSQPLLHLETITMRYNTQTVLHNFQLQLFPKELLCILGPSGCGKTTILKIAGSFIHPDSGQVYFRGVPVIKPDQERIMIFQEHNQLFPWKTVLHNVIFGLKHSKKYSDQPKKHLQKIAIHALQEAGLHNSANKYPHQLSGGMHQRATLARAFSGHPQLLLMDEPFASIDSIGRKDLQDLLLALRQEYGTSVIFVTHDIQEALKIGDRILVLNQKGEHLLEADPHQADCRLQIEQAIQYDTQKPVNPSCP